ncbi:Calcineurin-like phosphoesterase [Lutibacter oricola]|uniref:Calcineurin-like phosphoesterase n=1 Tax=Lutibacter oricola TaxID=762486 RepID=A0A1H3ALD9_9FLAO|nr:metallophosphoesterase [Lutibacter oricola]SDX29639.1 Calcineurin-like phosphoesterase [Lutibacter oricola]
MSRYFISKLAIAILLLTTYSCATYKKNYTATELNWQQNIPEYNSEIEHTFYLIGDAGNAELNQPLSNLQLLKEELSNSNKNSTALFLGDNLYPVGLVKKNSPNRAIAEHRLNAQIDVVSNFKGKTIFIPGNHDYYSEGVKGLKRQQDFIEKKLGKNTFQPENGCPLEKIDISDELVLIIVDTQWYLEDWNKNPTINDDCEIKTREKFFQEYEGLIKKNATKTVLIALHHPMFSNGNHGGQSSIKQNMHPLPVLGTVKNILRKTSGVSPQDMNNPIYLELKKRLVTISQKAEKTIFISGHEHNLQYIIKDSKVQIISGSGSKVNPVRTINGSKFSYGGLGYAKVNVYKNGASTVSFYTEKNNKQKLLYSTEIFPSSEKKHKTTYPSKFAKTVAASIYTQEEIEKSKFFKSLWGEHYRKYYGTKVNAPTVLLDTLMGGLTPIRKGGGNQSRSVRLKDKNGKEYVMRALRKSATQYMQAVAFKNDYIEGQFDDTYAEKLLLDIYTAAHPYAPFTTGKLSDAIGLYHTNPKLYYIPKQNALKQFNAEFGNELYMIEERTTKGHSDLASFGFSKDLISTDDLLKKLRKSDDNILDEPTYIRARLFDMLIGDWDRHEDQWRWAEFKEKKKTIYKPVPRDRDQAFSKNDGLILGFLTRTIPALKLMQVFDSEMRNTKWFNLEPYPLDISLINKATYKDWQQQVEFIQKNITDEVIEQAFLQMPVEVRDETVEGLKQKLKGRLKNLPKIAETYYKYLCKYALIKGNDKDNWFEIERLNNNQTRVQVYNIKHKKKGSKIFDKTYTKSKTKEIWVYGLDDEDIFKVTGVKSGVIPLRIVGGQNNDEYIIENGKRVTIYDYKSKKNTFKTSKGKQKLTNNYKTNVYNYKKIKYSQNQLIPSIGSNPDDGLKIGINDVFTVYGFERNPFTQQHILNASYYKATSGFDINYSAELANVFNNWNFLLETQFTSPNFSMNYYGFGNNSINNEDALGENYHRVKISTIALKPSLKWIGRMGAKISLGALYESLEVEDTSNRYINTVYNFIEQRKNYAGVHASYSYKNADNHAYPTLGMSFSLDTGWKTNIDNSSENNAYIIPALSFDYKLVPNGKLVLATKLKGNIIIGDNFEFYNAASVGGTDGLRGYRNQRFIGKEAFYQNTDLRWSFKKVKTELVPLQLGLYGGFDYGRVWYTEESSNEWKTSYGGGFWLVGANMINLNLAMFDSKEGPYFQFGLGFGF